MYLGIYFPNSNLWHINSENSTSPCYLYYLLFIYGEVFMNVIYICISIRIGTWVAMFLK